MGIPFKDRLLAHPRIFDTYQSLIGAPRCHERFIREMVKPRAGERVLDLGCGVGASVRYLPAGVEYVGVDINEAYIAKARKNHGDRGEFICADAETLNTESLGTFDRAFSFGVLHHLSDKSAERVIAVVRRIVRPGGSYVTIDPCREPGQHPVARMLAAQDRGEFIRDASQFKALLGGLGTVRSQVYHDLLRVPFTQIVMEVAVGVHGMPAAGDGVRSPAR